MTRLSRLRWRVWLAALFLGCVLPAVAAPLPARGSVEVLFSPWDDAEGEILRVLAAARETVHVQAYLITSRNLGRGLLAAHRRGVAVRVLADREMALRGEPTQLDLLAADGVEVRLEDRYAAAHNKVMLVDALSMRPVVITGSYNFTWSAQARNAENLLVLRDHPELARRYLDNWQRHAADALPWTGARSGGND